MWEANEDEYENYIAQNHCPFLVDKSCSIYKIRPRGCRLFPLTAFGMLSQDCEPLNRFKKQCTSLKKGRILTETYHFESSYENSEPIKPAKASQKQRQTCVAQLLQAGMTKDALILFNRFNE